MADAPNAGDLGREPDNLDDLFEWLDACRLDSDDREMVNLAADALARLRSALDESRGLLAEAYWWLTDAEAHAEANETGQIKAWMKKVDTALGAKENL